MCINKLTILLTNKSHPFFKAHFPKNEILAGFLQIDIIADVLKHSVKKINKAKFLSIIKPDDIIKYCISSKDNISYKIIIKNQILHRFYIWRFIIRPAFILAIRA